MAITCDLGSDSDWDEVSDPGLIAPSDDELVEEDTRSEDWSDEVSDAADDVAVAESSDENVAPQEKDTGMIQTQENHVPLNAEAGDTNAPPKVPTSSQVAEPAATGSENDKNVLIAVLQYEVSDLKHRIVGERNAAKEEQDRLKKVLQETQDLNKQRAENSEREYEKLKTEFEVLKKRGAFNQHAHSVNAAFNGANNKQRQLNIKKLIELQDYKKKIGKEMLAKDKLITTLRDGLDGLHKTLVGNGVVPESAPPQGHADIDMERLRRMHMGLAAWSANLQALQAKAIHFEQRCNALSLQRNGITEQLKIKDEQISAHARELACQKALELNFKTLIRSAQGDMETYQSELATAQQQIKVCKDEANVAEGKRVALKKEYDELERKYVALQVEYDELHNQCEELQDREYSASTNADMYLSSNQDLKYDIEDHLRDLNHAKDEHEVTKGTLKLAQEQLVAKDEQIAMLQDKMKYMIQTIQDGLRKTIELPKVTKELEQTRAQVLTGKIELDLVRSALADSKSHEEVAAKQVVDATKNINDLKEAMEELKTREQKLSQNTTLWKSTVGKYSTALKKLAKDLATVKESMTKEMNDKIKALEERHLRNTSIIERDLEQARKHVDDAKHEFSRSKQAEKIMELETQVRIQAAHNIDLNKRTDEMRAKIDSRKAEVLKLVDERDSFRASYREFCKGLQARTKELEDSIAENKLLQETVEANSRQVVKLECEIKQKEKEIQRMHGEHISLVADNADLQIRLERGAQILEDGARVVTPFSGDTVFNTSKGKIMIGSPLHHAAAVQTKDTASPNVVKPISHAERLKKSMGITDTTRPNPFRPSSRSNKRIPNMIPPEESPNFKVGYEFSHVAKAGVQYDGEADDEAGKGQKEDAGGVSLKVEDDLYSSVETIIGIDPADLKKEKTHASKSPERPVPAAWRD